MMTLNHKPLDSINAADLQALVDQQLSEIKTVEYKKILPGKTDSDRKEFLADVSSFANAAGGDLIFGVSAKAGLPVEVCGLQTADADAEVLRLENMMRDSIQPRILGVSVKAVPLQKAAVAIIIRIPRSWALPHMVVFQKDFRFYARNSAGKYTLDVSELRRLFALSETTAEHIRNFRLQRLAQIVADETPVKVGPGAKAVIQIVPLGAFEQAAHLDLSVATDPAVLARLNRWGWKSRHNFDGVLLYNAASQGPVDSYLQIFRNGIIEAVTTRYVYEDNNKRGIVPEYEQELIAELPKLLAAQKQLGTQPPMLVMLSWLGVSGCIMGVPVLFALRHEIYPIDRDTLLVPEVLLENFECVPAEVLRPVFDAVWNAAGWPQSMNYDATGKWTGKAIKGR